jgi:hypothetical protein
MAGDTANLHMVEATANLHMEVDMAVARMVVVDTAYVHLFVYSL